MSNLPMHYRYDSYSNDGEESILYLTKWAAIYETPCGYYVVPDWLYCGVPSRPERYGKSAKWVSKTSHKRYCYPTKEDAFESLKIRKSRLVEHAKRRLRLAQSALDKASSHPTGTVPEVGAEAGHDPIHQTGALT